jgi:PTS system nitrogen regulatory IIA component
VNLVHTLGKLLGQDIARERSIVPRESAHRNERADAARPWIDWLRPQEVVLDVDVQDGKGAIEVAAAHIGRAHGLDPAPILRALMRREQAGSTALGHGVAIPHGRIAGLARPLTLFMRTRKSIPFGAPDGKPVSTWLVIMVPADGATDEHLQLLALVAGAFSDRDFRASIAAATSPAQVDGVFADWVKHHAQ